MNKNYIYGRNTVIDALKYIKVYHLYLLEGFKDKYIFSLINEKHISYSFVDINKLRQLSNNNNHQGIVAEVDKFSYSSLDDIISYSKQFKNPIILILDEINDPMNFGAIIRSADAFKVAGIIIKKHNQVGVTPVVYKASTGAINHIKIAVVSNLNQTLEKLHKNGFWSVAADGSGKTNYEELDYNFPCALIIGSEGYGISNLVLTNSDYIVKINMYGHVNCLNASVATGILLSYIRLKNKI